MRRISWKDLMNAAMVEVAYSTWSARADAILHLVNGGSGRKRLPASCREERMEYFVTRFGLAVPERRGVIPPAGVAMTNDVYNPIIQRVSTAVIEFSKRLLDKNREPRITTRAILRFLDECADDETRIVAFSSLMRRPVIPYAQIPRGLLMVSPPRRSSKEEDAHLWRSLALLRRLIHDENINELQRLAGIGGVIGEHTHGDDRQCLVHALIHLVERRIGDQHEQSALERRERAKAFFKEVATAGGLPFPLSGGDEESCGDSLCPTHGVDAQAKKKKEDKPS